MSGFKAGDFAHVSDEGVRKYLEEGSDDFNVVAKQLDCAYHHLTEDAKNLCLPFEIVEKREALYDYACEYFGWRNLKAVQEYLKTFWSV